MPLEIEINAASAALLLMLEIHTAGWYKNSYLYVVVFDLDFVFLFCHFFLSNVLKGEL